MTASKPLFATERWNDVRTLLERMDGLSDEARELELVRIASTDPDLACAARSLAGMGMRHGATPPDATIAEAVRATAPMPTSIGPFRLLRPIGSGGMGEVYLAEREGAGFTQRVALKLLDGGGARMSRMVVRERHILSSLTHPNITAFVDAGDADGCAWLAMEYVDGHPLRKYCWDRRLDLRARVHLFDQICAAVMHAHAQLVVHRDLKPSNVLVTGDGTVKLLDFGIARVLDAEHENTPATLVFTPEYAAPEQLRGERVTVATDVYALGLMLYELLCGQRLPASTRDTEWTATELARSALTAAQSSTDRTDDPKTLSRLLRGDLGRILAHALAPALSDRYASVALLREDLRCWLEHRPLRIGRHTAAYLATRFVRRHRAAVAIVAIAVIALIVTTGVALWQAHDARLMAARADQARTFLADLFTDANPYAAGRNGTDVASLMGAAAQRIDAEFADDPGMQVKLRATMAEALLRLGQPGKARDLIQHNIDQVRKIFGASAPQVGTATAELALASENNGELDIARTLYNEAYALLQNAGPNWTRDRITAMTGLADMASRRGDYAEAQRWYEAVLREREAAEGPRSADIAMDLMGLSVNAQDRERFADSENFAMRAHVMLEQVLGPGHPRSIYVDNALGSAQIRAGHCVAAITTLQNAIAVARRRLPPGAPMLGFNLANLGQAQACAGNDAAGIATLREARDIFTAAHNPALGTLELRLGLVELHAHSKQALQTLNSSRADLAAATSHYAGSLVYALWAQAAYADAIAVNGNVADGEHLARDARAKLQAGKNSGSFVLGEIDLLLADVLDRQSAPADAHSLREEALTIFQRVYGTDHPKTRELSAQLIAAVAH